MNVLAVSSEVAPFAKTGGLGDVTAALSRHLTRRGHDVRLFVPYYRRVREAGVPVEPVPGCEDLALRLGERVVRFGVGRARLPDSDAWIYFVSCPTFFDRPGIYTRDEDEHRRFLLLERAALAASQHMGFGPHVAHVHDWQGALLPLILRTDYGWDRLFAGTRTVLTIHNLNHQGIVGAEALPDTGLAGSAHLFHQEHLRAGFISFLATGILYADAITTVSPTYAREIQTRELGAGLDDLLRSRRAALHGILNGVDDDWNPATDRHLPVRFSPGGLEGKRVCKQHLLERLALPFDERVPLAGVVSRLVPQKGLDLLFDVLPPLLARQAVQLVVLGSGEDRLEAFFAGLQRRFPRLVCFYRGFSDELAHLIEAGADLFLMPSRYEPCGLNQMYSLRYGTVPVVRRTGGLADTVAPFDPTTGQGNGFVFDHPTAEGLGWAVGRALALWPNRPAWRRMQLAGMAQDFSWGERVRSYEDIYAGLRA